MADIEEMDIEDGSNDKAYFTMVPNIVLNHSSAVDQALYMQMKRFAGEKSGGGLCTASHRTLMEKLKIGPKALKTSLEYLTGHGWIANVGSRKVMTPGGPQDVQTYRVNDIWKLNVQHYKGASESAPLPKGGDERNEGANERSKGGDESATTKNNTKTVDTCGLEDSPRVVKVYEEEETHQKRENRSKDKEAIYALFSSKEEPWWRHAQQKKAALSLFDLLGVEKVRAGLRVMNENEDDPYCPQAQTPFDYEVKLPKLKAYAKRNG